MSNNILFYAVDDTDIHDFAWMPLNATGHIARRSNPTRISFADTRLRQGLQIAEIYLQDMG